MTEQNNDLYIKLARQLSHVGEQKFFFFFLKNAFQIVSWTSRSSSMPCMVVEEEAMGRQRWSIFVF
jgi:hypothetical protein